MSEIDKAIERIRSRRRDIEAQIAGLQKIADGMDGELRGLEYAKELFPQVAAPSGRQDVQGPVMRLFADGGTWGEDAIIETVNRLPREADIPAASIHKFLVRAVRDGKLVLTDEGYRLPQIARAAE